jgi:hypothetical protein
MSREALVWTIGISAVLALSILLGSIASRSAAHRADVRHHCEHISHSEQAQLMPVSTTSTVVLMPVDVTEDCYRCPDGFVECF